MKHLSFVLVLATATLVTSCSKSVVVVEVAGPAKHEHHAPHGGTPLVLGNEAYHLELVRDGEAGKLTAYVLDGEMENFIRLRTATIEMNVTAGGAKRALALAAVANSATGETIGDTAQFEATADWLKTSAEFDGVIPKIEIRGQAFENVAFNFPHGNDRER